MARKRDHEPLHIEWKTTSLPKEFAFRRGETEKSKLKKAIRFLDKLIDVVDGASMPTKMNVDLGYSNPASGSSWSRDMQWGEFTAVLQDSDDMGRVGFRPIVRMALMNKKSQLETRLRRQR